MRCWGGEASPTPRDCKWPRGGGLRREKGFSREVKLL